VPTARGAGIGGWMSVRRQADEQALKAGAIGQGPERWSRADGEDGWGGRRRRRVGAGAGAHRRRAGWAGVIARWGGAGCGGWSPRYGQRGGRGQI
jgi:hypothetical protein